jgi:hypothetical protein
LTLLSEAGDWSRHSRKAVVEVARDSSRRGIGGNREEGTGCLWITFIIIQSGVLAIDCQQLDQVLVLLVVLLVLFAVHEEGAVGGGRLA